MPRRVTLEIVTQSLICLDLFSKRETMAGSFDVRGYMDSEFKGKSPNFFAAIYEALNNSLEAIQSRKFVGSEKPFIAIKIDFQLDMANGYEFKKLTISDNGVGLDSDNYGRFKTFFITNKGFHNKGTGRFQFLHNFDFISINSTYEEGGKRYKRNVSLSVDNAVTNVDPTEVNNTESILTSIIMETSNLAELSADMLRKISLQEFAKKIQNHFIVRFFLLDNKNHDLFPEIKFIFNKDKEEILSFTSADIIKPSMSGDLEIPYTLVHSDGGKLELTTSTRKEKIQYAKFEIPMDDLSKNRISLCSRGIEVEPVENAKVFFVNDTFKGCRLQASFYGGILDKPENVNAAGNAFTFISKKEYKDQFKDTRMDDLFGEKEFIASDEIRSKIVEKTKEICADVAATYDGQAELAKRIARQNGIPEEIVDDITMSSKDKPEDLTKKIYKEQAEKFATNAIEIQKKIEKIEKLDPTSDTYQDDLQKHVCEMSDLVDEQDKEELARHVIRRKLVLSIFEKLNNKKMECQTKKAGERLDAEGFFHDMFIKRKRTTKEINDLWVLNDEYIYFDGSSDIPLNEIKDKDGNYLLGPIPDDVMKEYQLENDITQRPDIYFFQEDGKCIIIELKRPEVPLRNYLDQLPRYAEIIANYSQVPVDRFFCYLIGEKVLEKKDLIRDYTESVTGCWARSLNIKSFETQKNIAFGQVEVWKLSNVLEHAKRRNKIYFQKLGIDEDVASLKILTKDIVTQAQELIKNKVGNIDLELSYACVFAQTNSDYEKMEQAAKSIGLKVDATETGNVYEIPRLLTSAGWLHILKIRKPDATRPELGDADFKLKDYARFKKAYSDKPGFKVIDRKEYEMIELMETDAKVRVYFSNPPVKYELKLTGGKK